MGERVYHRECMYLALGVLANEACRPDTRDARPGLFTKWSEPVPSCGQKWL